MVYELVQTRIRNPEYEIRRKNGEALYKIRKKKRRVMKTWKIVDAVNGTEEVELTYFQRLLIFPGFKIRIRGEEKAALRAQLSFRWKYKLTGCGLSFEPRFESRNDVSCLLKRGGKEIAWTALIEDGEDVIRMYVDDHEDALLCLAIMLSHDFCGEMLLDPRNH